MIDALPLLLGPEGYQISRSVRLRSSASAYFNRTFTTPTNAAKWTFNRWVKRGAIGARQSLFAAGTSGSSYANIEFKADDTIQFLSENSAVQFQLVTTQVFRDPSAWYNIHIIYDSANATSTDRIQLWINGVRVTAFSTATYPTTTPNNLFNTAIAHQIGVLGYGSVAYFDGYQTELNFIDGQALTPSSFGETDAVTGVWQPKKYAGTYGTNGFYLNFSDNSAATASAIGKDYSGNGNNWTPNNISVTAGATYDSMLDVPTQWADGGNGRGNYATWNPISRNTRITVANGNLSAVGDSTVTHQMLRSVFGLATGKWYWEVTGSGIGTGAGSNPVTILGMYDGITNPADGVYVGSAGTSGGRGWGTSNSTIYANNATTSGTVPGLENAAMGFAYDADNRKLWFRNSNGTWVQGDPAAGTSASITFNGTETMFPAVSFSGTSPGTLYLNAGQTSFANTPPSGFKALNTLNLPTPTILKGNQYFDATTYNGNGSTQSIVNSGGMQPDLVWIKARNATANHAIFDSSRGTGKVIQSNTTAAEATDNTTLTAFDSSGFSLGAAAGSYIVNTNTYTFVGWQWKEGATQGFDIVTYTGTGANRTIAHSLGVAPAMIIIKNRSQVATWIVGHQNMAASSPWNGFMQLNQTAAYTTSGGSLIWNNTAPTSSVFSVGTDTSTNFNGNNFVAYLFAEVAGFSKAFSYTGNGSADGPFVFLGFRPRWIMLKRTDSTGNWFIWDTARDPQNTILRELYPDSSSAEVTRTGSSDSLDALSNGFKIRFSSTYADRNASGGTYIGMAFSEVPFKNALAR